MSPETLESQPLDELVGAFSSIYAQTGKLKVAAVEEKSEYEAVIKAESTQLAAWLDINFSVEKDQPHHQLMLGLTPGRAPQAATYENWTTIPELLTQLREETGAPSIAVSIVKSGVVYQSAVSGVRQHEGLEKAKIADAFHIGSVAKSMTAVLIGKLIEEGKLDWHTTLGEVLEESEFLEEYKDVTIIQLLNHQGGLPAFVDDQEFDLDQFVDDQLAPDAQRLAFATEALNRNPVSQPGQGMTYSNAGYVVLGVVAERVASKPYESMMAEYVFEPLGLESAGFGWPNTPATPNTQSGHYRLDGKVKTQAVGEVSMGHFLVPAGDMHLSIEDLAKYATLHLTGLSGTDGLLSSTTVKNLHQPPTGQSYAAGWSIGKAPDESPMHFHNGSLGTFYAAVFLYPEHDAAIVFATNIGSSVEPDVLKAAEAIFKKVIR